MNISFIDNKLTIGKITILLENQIKEVVHSKDLIFVILKEEINGKLFPRNLVAFKLNGQKLWEVENLHNPKAGSWFFKNIEIADSGNLIGYNWCSLTYEIDRNTGKILKSERS